jgi:hypothetical protein
MLPNAKANISQFPLEHLDQNVRLGTKIWHSRFFLSGMRNAEETFPSKFVNS